MKQKIRSFFGANWGSLNIVKTYLSYFIKRNVTMLGLYKTKYTKSEEYRVILTCQYDNKLIVFCAKPHSFPSDIAYLDIKNLDGIYKEVLT